MAHSAEIWDDIVEVVGTDNDSDEVADTFHTDGRTLDEVTAELKRRYGNLAPEHVLDHRSGDANLTQDTADKRVFTDEEAIELPHKELVAAVRAGRTVGTQKVFSLADLLEATRRAYREGFEDGQTSPNRSTS